ncbi:MAG: 3D domain-containing protein [Truepera sp.]|nr:3D domain-containing protein [Truepera sp.]
MILHISSKLCAIGLAIALLIAALSQEQRQLPLAITPQIELLIIPRSVAPSAGAMHGPALPILTLRATAYNSLTSQTDAQPHITATGARTHFGIIAVSRDLLGNTIPYGSLVRLRDLGSYHHGRGVGKFQALLDQQGLFIVEDTMHPRKRQQIDVWFEYYSEAIRWGLRRIELEVVRYGRDGPLLTPVAAPFDATPQLLASAPRRP